VPGAGEWQCVFGEQSAGGARLDGRARADDRAWGDSESVVVPANPRASRGEAMFVPTGFQVLDYVRRFMRRCGRRASRSCAYPEDEEYLNYIGLELSRAEVLHDIRRVTTEVDFFRLCEEYLSHDRPMPLEPFSLDLKETDVMAGEHL